MQESANERLTEQNRKTMKMAYVSEIRAAHLGLGERFVAMMASFAERKARYTQYRTTVNELSQLTNRDLADIGLNRSQIKSIAYEHAYGASK